MRLNILIIDLKTIFRVKEPTRLLLSKSFFEISAKGREKKSHMDICKVFGRKNYIVLLFQPQNLYFYCADYGRFLEILTNLGQPI